MKKKEKIVLKIGNLYHVIEADEYLTEPDYKNKVFYFLPKKRLTQPQTSLGYLTPRDVVTFMGTHRYGGITWATLMLSNGLVVEIDSYIAEFQKVTKY